MPSARRVGNCKCVPLAPRALLVSLVPALLAVTLAAPAAAAPGGWQESHRTADDVRVVVGPDGLARIEHHVRYRVVAGRFRSFELAGVDVAAELEPEARVTADAPPEVRPGSNSNTTSPTVVPTAHVERSPKTPGVVRITVDDPKGLPRGSYTIDVAYKLDLVATSAIVRDGAMWRLAWTAPAAPEGMDGARVTFDLPAAPTEPSLASSEQSTTTIATARHNGVRDELELVRAHVPRGEAVTWAVRIDPKGFPDVKAPELRTAPPALAPPPAHSSPSLAIASAVVLAAVAALLAWARRAKQVAVAHACAARGILPRPLVPVPATVAPVAYGLSVPLALAAFLWASPVVGSVLLVVAMALAAFRPPRVLSRPRGPGRWTEVDDATVFVAPRPDPAAGDALDLGTRKGRIVALLVAAAVGGAAFALRHHVPYAHVALPLAATALVPLFATGIRAQLPPSPAQLAARLLAPARDVLAKDVDLAHVDLVPIARLREGSRAVDEVRLACAPAVRIPGLRAIELALATSTEAPEAAVPQVLVRFDDGSSAASKVAAIAPGMEIVVGRTPEEKVLRVTPRIPTARAAARLVARLLGELEGRRASDRNEEPAPFRGDERRGKRRKRIAASASAAAA